MILMPPQSLPDLLRDLITARYGLRGRSAFARDAGVHHTTVSRILAGSLVPTPDTLAVLASPLGTTEAERADVLARLRTAAGLAATEPPPLRWPAEVRHLTPVQRRALQRVVNVVVAGFTEEPTPDADDLAAGIEVTETPIPWVPEGRGGAAGTGPGKPTPPRRGLGARSRG